MCQVCEISMISNASKHKAVSKVDTLGLTEPRMGLLLLLEPGVFPPGLSPATWLSEADFFIAEEGEAPGSWL